MLKPEPERRRAGYYDGIVRLGVFNSDMNVIRSLTGRFTATVELAT